MFIIDFLFYSQASFNLGVLLPVYYFATAFVFEVNNWEEPVLT